MSPYVLFHTHLHRFMTRHKISADHLQHELNYRTSIPIQSWPQRLVPSGPRYPSFLALANVLKALTLVEMIAVGGSSTNFRKWKKKLVRWRFSQPRGSTFPRSDDLGTCEHPGPKRRCSYGDTLTKPHHRLSLLRVGPAPRHARSRYRLLGSPRPGPPEEKPNHVALILTCKMPTDVMTALLLQLRCR